MERIYTSGRARPQGLGRRTAGAGSLVCIVSVLPLLCVVAPAGATELCRSTHWVAAWAGVPTDASTGTDLTDFVDPAGDLKVGVDNSTVRAIVTPSLGGSVLRIRLSNRFGSAPVTFSHTTIGRQASGATLTGAALQIRFSGRPWATAQPGQEVVSDPVVFSYKAFENLAVSAYVAGNAGLPTEHYTARQTSYLTPEGAGDHAGDRSGGAFLDTTTSRPFVTGVEVAASSATGSVVAFGDSLTDGYQGLGPEGQPESPEGRDANVRWPDDLARRVIAAHTSLSVVNAGISGNRILHAGSDSPEPHDVFGPSGLSRLGTDVLEQGSAATVIWLEGINDLGNGATPAEVIAGLQEGVRRMEADHLEVVLGTLTPAGGDLNPGYGSEAANRAREEVNAWIRSQPNHVDFDAAVRDPSNPGVLNPAYDAGDHLHMNPAGYQAMANAINLNRLVVPRCSS
jgi:lysophospholipase L1-like esterase